MRSNQTPTLKHDDSQRSGEFSSGGRTHAVKRDALLDAGAGPSSVPPFDRDAKQHDARGTDDGPRRRRVETFYLARDLR